MSSESMPRRAARSVTAPAREYFNGHFEMLKQEIRHASEASAPAHVDLEPVLARLDELAELLAEQGAHQARSLARQTEETAALRERVEELEHILHRLVSVVAPVDVE